MSPYAALCDTGEFHVPRKSAPNATTYRDRARSNVGSCAWPKLIALARRSTSSPNSSNGIGGGAPKRVRSSVKRATRRLRDGRVRQATDFWLPEDARASSLLTSSAIASSHAIGFSSPLPRDPDRLSGVVRRSGWYVIWIDAWPRGHRPPWFTG